MLGGERARTRVRVLHVCAHRVPPPPHHHQTAPGVFNEKMLAALDATLAAAAAAGVRVSLSLLNNWNYNDASKDTKCGIARMAKGSPKLTGAECDAAFWGNDAAKQIYKDYVKAIVTRTNSVTGVKYVDDG